MTINKKANAILQFLDPWEIKNPKSAIKEIKREIKNNGGKNIIIYFSDTPYLKNVQEILKR